MTNTSARKKRSRGTAIVEASFIFLVFLLMLIGVFDFGQFLFVHQALVERARGAARWGAINDPTDTNSIQNKVLYDQPTAPTSGSSYFGLTTSMVQVSTSGSGTDNYRLTVLITNYPYQMLSPYITGTYSGPNVLVSIPLGLD